MSLLEGLRFKPGNSFVHRLDPRTKLLTSLLILATALVYIDALVITIVLLAEAFLIKVAGVTRLWVKTIKGSIPFAILVFVVTFLTEFSENGLVFQTYYQAFTYAYRVVLFLSSFSLFFLTTTPDEIALTLAKMRVPYQYTFAFVSAIRFTPVLAQEMRNIMDAQKARGLELEKGNFMQRIRKLIPVMVPLLVNVLRRSYELAEAMEVKCFGVSKKRTFLKELRFRKSDYIFHVIVITLFIAGIYGRAINLEPALLLLSNIGFTK